MEKQLMSVSILVLAHPLASVQPLKSVGSVKSVVYLDPKVAS